MPIELQFTFLQLYDITYELIYSVIQPKFRASLEPLWTLKNR